VVENRVTHDEFIRAGHFEERPESLVTVSGVPTNEYVNI